MGLISIVGTEVGLTTRIEGRAINSHLSTNRVFQRIYYIDALNTTEKVGSGTLIHLLATLAARISNPDTNLPKSSQR